MKLAIPALAFAILFLSAVLTRAETKVIRGDTSKLPMPDPSRQIERKTADGFQKTIDMKSFSTSPSFETRAWTGSSPSVPMKAWSGSPGDFYARSIQAGAFEAHGTPPSSWLKKGGSFERDALTVSQSELNTRGTAVKPVSVPAGVVELPPDLTEEDARTRFRVTKPLMEVGPSGTKKTRGEATVEREVAPVRVGGASARSVRVPPETSPPQTPAVSK